MAHAAVMYVKELKRMVEFYGALGFRIEEQVAGGYAVLVGSDLELSLVQIPEPVASEIQISHPPQIRERTPIKLAFVVGSIEGTLRAVESKGGQSRPATKRWTFRGYSVQDAVDAEGNVYQLREPCSA